MKGKGSSDNRHAHLKIIAYLYDLTNNVSQSSGCAVHDDGALLCCWP